MMKTVVVCEGHVDEVILRAGLAGDAESGMYTIVPAGGRSPATSLARTHLATGSERTALVVDADTTDQRKVAEQELILADLLALAGSRERFLVLQAVPEIEAWLFENEEFAKELFGASLSDQAMYRAKFEPCAVLSELLGLEGGAKPDAGALSRLLASHDTSRLCNIRPIVELRDFITAPVAAT